MLDPMQELARIQRWLGGKPNPSRVKPLRCEEMRQLVMNTRRGVREQEAVATAMIRSVVPYAVIGMVRSFEQWVGFEPTVLVSSLNIDAASCRCPDLEVNLVVNNWQPQEEELILADSLRGWCLITQGDHSASIPAYRSDLYIWRTALSRQ